MPSTLPHPSSDASALRDWLFDSALPAWWTLGADTAHGGFHETLTPGGAPTGARKRIRVQARQAFSYATAGLMGWEGPWKRAMEHGMDFLLTRYRRADGLYRTLVEINGAPADEAAFVYDQAFVLLALAAAAQAVPGMANDCAARAADLRSALQALRHPIAGFREGAGPHPQQSNAHMHMLEASLAWAETTGEPAWEQLADEIAELALARFIQPRTGALLEFFDEEWRPAPGADGARVEPGHQFEWAWLLTRYGARRSDARASQAAVRLLAMGERGVDPRNGVATDAITEESTPVEATARLWPQTEWVKARAILSSDAERAGAVGAPIQALQGYLDHPTRGLWWDRRLADGRFVTEASPASSLYHIICAVQEAGRA
ncbi:MAG: AGE family epimerase/isomerase [Caulobacteraceae bacterium]|nr:AGE family epimerase/isomerase [Caulobacteraceae bacterium]